MLKNWLRRKLEAAVESDTHTIEGKRKGDARQVEWPVGVRRPPTLHEQIQAALRSQALIQRQEELGRETLEDSMDFGWDDDPEDFGVTMHEMRDLKEARLRDDLALEERKKRREAFLAKRGGAVREPKERVQDDAGRGGVRQPQGREDVPGRDAGGGASSVRSVEPSAGPGKDR